MKRKLKKREKGKKNSYKKVEDLNQQTEKCKEQTEHIAEEGKDFMEEPKVVNSLFPEVSTTNETTSKQVKEDLKNPDTLSMVIKNVNSKEEERI